MFSNKMLNYCTLVGLNHYVHIQYIHDGITIKQVPINVKFLFLPS